MTLRACQCFLIAHEDCDPELGQITEILGFTAARRDEVYIRVWETKLKRPLVYRDTLTITPNTLSTGRGSNVTRRITDPFHTETVKSVTITSDIEGKGKKQPRLSRQYLTTREYLAPITRLTPTVNDSIVAMITDIVKDSGLYRVKIFTDGS